MAAKYGHASIVQILLDNGAYIRSRTVDYWTPLHVAAWYGHLPVVLLLVERGADINDDSKVK
jgi:ankyrin repeat protein